MSAEIKSVQPDPNSPDAVFIFSFNEVLGKHFCHHLKLDVPSSGGELMQE